MWSFGRRSGSSISSGSTDHQALTNIVTGCSTSNHTDYLSYDADTWTRLQEAHDAVKDRYASDWHSGGHSRASKGGSEHVPHSGMKVPFAIRLNPKNGLRQVMVTRDIPKGYTIWDSIHYHTFQTEHAYVEFLEELPHHLQCEVLSWTHPSWINKELYVDITLDEGTFIQETSNNEDINIDIDCITLRELKAGEFIYMGHTDYLLPPTSTESSSSLPYTESGIQWFDAIRSTAWKRTGLGMGRSALHSAISNSNHHSPLEAPSIAPGVAVLSALYLVAKLLRSRNQKSSLSSLSSYNYDVDDNGYYGASFCYAQKSKLA